MHACNADTAEAVLRRVRGTTFTRASDRRWVTWMVASGAENGQCHFDGRGAELPHWAKVGLAGCGTDEPTRPAQTHT
jgi:hypothetical protein